MGHRTARSARGMSVPATSRRQSPMRAVTPNRLNETEPSEFDAGRQVMIIGGVSAAVGYGIGHLITSLAGQGADARSRQRVPLSADLRSTAPRRRGRPQTVSPDTARSMQGAVGRLGAWLGATWRIWAPLAAALATLAAGAVAWIGGQADVANAIWGVGVAIVLVPLTVSVVRDLVHGDVGVDLIALAAMVGALAIGEYLAGVVIAIMLAGGNALEAAASHRARRELTRLIQRAPRTALVRSADGIVEVPVDAVVPGDVVVVRAGEIAPVDGIVIGGRR